MWLSTKIKLLCFLSACLVMTYNLSVYAEKRVLETYKAGPEQVEKKVYGVKTNFMWNKPGDCNCPSEQEAPCIKTFLDKDNPTQEVKYPSRIEDYYIQNNMGDPYTGAGSVPWGMEASSVRLFTFPFCRGLRKAEQEAQAKKASAK